MFNFTYQKAAVTSSWSGAIGPGMMSTHNGTPNPPAEQTEYTLYPELGNHPVFRRSPAAMFSSNITFAIRNEMLAKGIPALSAATGKTSIAPDTVANFNMNTAFKPENGAWPRDNNHVYKQRWLHSDAKDLAYLYVSRLFDRLVQEGELK